MVTEKQRKSYESSKKLKKISLDRAEKILHLYNLEDETGMRKYSVSKISEMLTKYGGVNIGRITTNDIYNVLNKAEDLGLEVKRRGRENYFGTKNNKLMKIVQKEVIDGEILESKYGLENILYVDAEVAPKPFGLLKAARQDRKLGPLISDAEFEKGNKPSVQKGRLGDLEYLVPGTAQSYTGERLKSKIVYASMGEANISELDVLKADISELIIPFRRLSYAVRSGARKTMQSGKMAAEYTNKMYSNVQSISGKVKSFLNKSKTPTFASAAAMVMSGISLALNYLTPKK